MSNKKIKLICFIFLCAFTIQGKNNLSIQDIQCSQRYNKEHASLSIPVFSWKITSDNKNVLQTAYEIKVAKNQQDLESGKNLIWSSDKVLSDQSAFIEYKGPALEIKQDYYWQVRVWDNKGKQSAWSNVDKWSSGLRASDWSAKWIETKTPEGDEQAILFGKAFILNGAVKQVKLYITSHGIYRTRINNESIDDGFGPGWTTYPKRTQYQIYDITHLLKEGDNHIDVLVGDGWYKGSLLHTKDFFGNRLSLLAQIEIEYTNGQREIIATNESWKTNVNNPVLKSGLYSGEIYDARKVQTNQTATKYDDKELWTNATLSPSQEYNQLVYSISPPVKEKGIVKPVQIITTPKGEKVIDFGQNMVGRVRFTVNGNNGDHVHLYHAEVLDKDGNIYTDNLREAKQQILYYLRGNEAESYEPNLTFQGFRYVKVEGNRELINESNIEGVVLYTDLAQTGSFTTSAPLLNQLQQNILWGQKGNFLDIPTDCPQRDERLGWTGDAQAFFNTATFNMDVSDFFFKWMADLRADQLENGGVPGIIPNTWGTGETNIGQAGWADAVTIIPWQHYQVYGDIQILEENYDAMKKWLDYIAEKSTGYLWNKSWHHGDWLSFMPKDVWDKAPAYTDKTLIAQAFYANSIQNVIHTATVLGHGDDVARYTQLLDKVKETFVAEFVTPNGMVMSNTQTAYILALQFDLLPEHLREQAAARLVGIIKEYDDHISTGFLGTPYICHVLSRYGYKDVAYKLLLQETYPSWLYPVKMGATTIWERWDGIKPDGTFQDVNMNSFNHYAYGAIGDWMYRNIGGINQKEGTAGYKHIVISPEIGGNLTSSATKYETVYGSVVSSWEIKDGTMTLDVEIPVNTNAEIVFPEIRNGNVTESGKIIPLTTESEKSFYKTGSGKYQFRFDVK